MHDLLESLVTLWRSNRLPDFRVCVIIGPGVLYGEACIVEADLLRSAAIST